jgi:hypothetical protein
LHTDVNTDALRTEVWRRKLVLKAQFESSL